MAYHINNLGAFAGTPTDPDAPSYYADKDGFVPEPGDKAVDFTSRSGGPYDPDCVGVDGLSWDAWVAAAAAATATAESAAEQWRRQ